jgi:hypothetical protein
MRTSGALRLLVVSTILATGTVLAASPVAAAPAVTVTPATGLLDGAVVTVDATGLTPRAQVLVVQCAGAAPDGCVLDPPINQNAALTGVDDSGNVRATLRLPRVLDLPGGAVDCSAGTCSVAVLASPGNGELARTAIDFEPTGTAPAPLEATFEIATLGMRADGGIADMTGAGYLPWFRTFPLAATEPVPTRLTGVTAPGAYLAVCTAPPSGWAGCERYASPAYPFPGSPGTTYSQTRVVPVDDQGRAWAHTQPMPRMWDTAGGRIDCAQADCSFALEQDGAPHSDVEDVAWLPEWAPYPSAAGFVAAAYPALLGRPATPSERATAIADLTDRTRTGYGLLLSLAGRSDARRLAELTRLYLAALGRRPDATGLVYWERELARTGSMSSIAVAFGRSPEFRQVFGAANVTEAVDLAYQRTLGRNPSGSERSYWIGRLRAGLARTHMIHLFSRTPEFLAREDGRSRATAITVGLLRRGPTADEWYLMGPAVHRDQRTSAQRVDDAVLTVLSSNQLVQEVGSGA